MNAPLDNDQIRAVQQSRMEIMALACNVALRILSARFLTTVSLLLQAGIFGWAMHTGGWDRLAVATVFAVGSWCLVNLDFKKEDKS